MVYRMVSIKSSNDDSTPLVLGLPLLSYIRLKLSLGIYNVKTIGLA